MSPPGAPSRAPRLALLLAGLGLLAVGAALVASWRAGPAPARSVDGEVLLELAPRPGVLQRRAAPELQPVGGLEGVLPARPGDVIHLERSALAAVGTLRVELSVPVAQEGEGPRPVRIYSGHRPPIELETAPLSGDRTRLRLDLPAAGFDRAGRYVVEIDSSEPGLFPLRRFAIEVR